MRIRTSSHWILAGSVAAGLALGGCAREDAAGVQAGAQGATHGVQGLVLVVDQPVADASKGKSGQAGQPAAATRRARSDLC